MNKTFRSTVSSAPRRIARQSALWVRMVLHRTRARIAAFMQRRPHRSFQLTRRRDYRRSLTLPGYWSFTRSVWLLLWRNKRLFGLLAVWYIVLSGVVVGVASQDSYTQLSAAFKGAGQNVAGGDIGPLSQAAILYLSAISGGLNTQPDPAQQAYAGLLGLLTWLTIVWLLRALMAGQKPRLRDGIYSAGAPIMATFLVLVVVVVQALPIAIASIGYGAATSTGLLDGGVEAMLFWAVAALLVALSLYWMSSSLIALVIVTLPGMYPMRALRTAGDLVTGRRLRILLRLLWMVMIVVVVWTVVMIPVILFNGWLTSVVSGAAVVPVVPYLLLVMSALTMLFVASYVYALYRKVVDDDAVQGTN